MHVQGYYRYFSALFVYAHTYVCKAIIYDFHLRRGEIARSRNIQPYTYTTTHFFSKIFVITILKMEILLQ